MSSRVQALRAGMNHDVCQEQVTAQRYDLSRQGPVQHGLQGTAQAPGFPLFPKHDGSLVKYSRANAAAPQPALDASGSCQQGRLQQFLVLLQHSERVTAHAAGCDSVGDQRIRARSECARGVTGTESDPQVPVFAAMEPLIESTHFKKRFATHKYRRGHNDATVPKRRPQIDWSKGFALQGTPIRIEASMTRIHKAALRSEGQLGLLLKLAGKKNIVTVQERDPFVPGFRNRAISRIRSAMVGLLDESNVPAQCLDHVRRSVGGTIVYNKHLVGRTRLRKRALQGLANLVLGVVSRDDDTNFHSEYLLRLVTHQPAAASARKSESLWSIARHAIDSPPANCAACAKHLLASRRRTDAARPDTRSGQWRLPTEPREERAAM